MLDRYLRNLNVEVEPFAMCLVDSHWRLTLPGPPVPMLHFIVQGSGTVTSPGLDHVSIGPNCLIVIPTGAIHSLDASGEIEHELRIDCVPESPPPHRIKAGEEGPPELVVGCGTLNIRYGGAIGLFDHMTDTLLVDLGDIPEVPILFQGILAEQASGQPGGPILQGAMMTQLLVHMFRKLSEQHSQALPWLTALNDHRLAAALDAIMKNPEAPHTVESLADVAHMSRSAFAKAFQQAFNRTPINLVNHVRMERAADLLRAGRLPVEGVATKMGYSSRSHFSQAFKNHTGMTPVEFRQG